MSGKKLIIYILTLWLCAVFTISAQAAEPIHYTHHASARTQIHIQQYLKQNHDLDILTPLIAGIDLNEDGIDELVLRDSRCDSESAACTHLILAEFGDDALVQLARIEARQLFLDGGYTSGVRNLLAMDNPANDFDLQLYVWEPQQSRYRIADQEPEPAEAQ